MMRSLVIAGGLVLFDLEKDIGESTNPAVQHPEVVQDLLKSHGAWNKQMADPSAVRPRK